jgi:hypothetical protein
MSKIEKHGNKKRPVKLNVAHSGKPSEYKRVVKLLEQKGMELALPEAEQHDLFEALAICLGGSADHGKALFGRCLRRLREWGKSQSFPQGFEYLAEIRPFFDFYESYPCNILFEGVD